MPYQKAVQPQLNIPDAAAAVRTDEATGMKIPVGQEHSHMLGIYHWNSEDGYQFGQCPELQHFAASNSDALDLAHQCLDAHDSGIEKAPYVSLREMGGLPSNLSKRCCLVGCGKTLNTDWWQVAPTYAMRGDPSLEGHAYWDLPQYNGQQVWFCSLDHAVEGGHILIEELNALGYAEVQPVEQPIQPATVLRIVKPS